MYGGQTSDNFGIDIVEQVKQRKAAEEAAHNAKLEAVRSAVMAEDAARQSLSDALAAKQKAAAEAVEQARIAAEESREKTLALVAWRNAGGTVAAFEDAWPEMRRKQIAERVTNADKTRQQATAAMYRSIF